MSRVRVPVSALCFVLLCSSIALAEPVEPYVPRVAYERAQRAAAPRSGGLLRYGWRVTKGAVLFGALGAGVGYFLGGPAAAAEWGVKGAGGGAAWRATLGSDGSGITKHSGRALAEADVQEAKGHFLRKHYYKVKGVAWSAVEGGVISGVASGAFGLILGGPASVVPSMMGGGLLGTAFGTVSGLAKAYVVPFFKRRSLGWSMSRARGALSALEEEPSNPALRDEARTRLQLVREKLESIPRLSSGQTRAYDALIQRAARQPGLVGLGAGL